MRVTLRPSADSRTAGGSPRRRAVAGSSSEKWVRQPRSPHSEERSAERFHDDRHEASHGRLRLSASNAQRCGHRRTRWTASPAHPTAVACADWTECGSATTRLGVARVACTVGRRTVPHMTAPDGTPVYRSISLADLLDDLLRGVDVMADTATFERAVADASTSLNVTLGTESACRARGTPS